MSLFKNLAVKATEQQTNVIGTYAKLLAELGNPTIMGRMHIFDAGDGNQFKCYTSPKLTQALADKSVTIDQLPFCPVMSVTTTGGETAYTIAMPNAGTTQLDAKKLLADMAKAKPISVSNAMMELAAEYVL